jgi:hopene-associated glycosyltransferase HpnB
MLLAASVLPVLIWVYLLLGRGWFWRVNRYRLPTLPAPEPGSTVAVVIPARDEAAVVEQAVTSLLRQQFNGEVQIFLVDDGSSDGTVEVARLAAERTGQPERLTIISAKLRPGWTGKMSAVSQGVERALASKPDYLLFTDADIEHGSESISRMVALADRDGWDLVSLMVKLETKTVAERALIPAFVFFFFLLYPPAWIASRHRMTAGAAGGCMLVRPITLERAGGIAAIRAEIIDDCALARNIKRSGGRVWLGLAENTRSTRAYESFGEIGRMISRTAFNQLRHSAVLLVGTILGLAVTYVLPVILALGTQQPYAFLGLAAWLMMAAAYLPMVRFYGLNPLWAVTLPGVAVFYGAATLHSAVKFWMGRGGEWKGRVQDADSSKSAVCKPS